MGDEQILVQSLEDEERWCIVRDVNIEEHLIYIQYLGFDPPKPEWIKEDSCRILKRATPDEVIPIEKDKTVDNVKKNAVMLAEKKATLADDTTDSDDDVPDLEDEDHLPYWKKKIKKRTEH